MLLHAGYFEYLDFSIDQKRWNECFVFFSVTQMNREWNSKTGAYNFKRLHEISAMKPTTQCQYKKS